MESEKKPQEQPGLERIAVKQFGTFQEADAARKAPLHLKGDGAKAMAFPTIAKVKVFARRSGLFDVVWYVRAEPSKRLEKTEERNSQSKPGKKQNRKEG